jgi:AmmeMemoRadiSam system protein B/AmmeMemoRadiSam system protein A
MRAYFARLVLVALVVLAPLGRGRPSIAATAEKQPQKVMGPAVAGLFYPLEEKELAKRVDELLAEAKPQRLGRLRALVCPHAGYEYSGKTAAIGYKQVAGLDVRTVIILGPSHTAIFQGAAVADADAYRTPLGLVPISAKAAELGRLKPFALRPPCEVHRPKWWERAPEELPAFGEETPHTWEHSVEVQLPFLQRVLPHFEVVPVVFGEVDPEAAADALLKILDDRTLLVASSDLTHYLPYETAKTIDTTTVRAVCSLSVEWFEEEEAGWEARANLQLACGKDPILTVMHVARKKGWKAKLLDYRNSGDTAGAKDAVVGYAAIAFYEPEAAPAPGTPAPAAAATSAGRQPAARRANEYSAAQRKFLLDLARKAVAAAAAGKEPPHPDAAAWAEKFQQPRACFVTLKKNHQLRGCVGTVFPRFPLYDAVLFAARSAAVEDHRFEPVKPEELPQIEIEVSVLTLPERVKFHSPGELLARLRPGVDGVVLRVGSHQGLFLPQVWEQLPDKKEFLNRLAEEKAGLEPTAWQQPDAKVLTYQVEAFSEESERATR